MNKIISKFYQIPSNFKPEMNYGSHYSHDQSGLISTALEYHPIAFRTSKQQEVENICAPSLTPTVLLNFVKINTNNL